MRRDEIRGWMLPGGALTFMLIILALAIAAETLDAGGRRLEGWEESAPIGGALEGFHAWAASEIYGAFREKGLGAPAAGTAVLLAGLGVELLEARYGDATGASVQDLVANCVGVAAGAAGLRVRYQYAAHIDAPADYRWWARIPFVPVNGQTNAFDIGPAAGPCLGVKYRGEPAGMSVGFTSLPVLPYESGSGATVVYAGYVSPRGFSFAAGHDAGREKLELGAAYRLEDHRMGLAIQALLADGKLGWGLTVYPR